MRFFYYSLSEPTRRQVGTSWRLRQRLGLMVLMCLGVASYTGFWMTMLYEDAVWSNRSFSPAGNPEMLARSNFLQEQQHAAKQYSNNEAKEAAGTPNPPKVTNGASPSWQQRHTNFRQRKDQRRKTDLLDIRRSSTYDHEDWENTANDENHRPIDKTDGDWKFWALCVCFGVLAYVRIRLEPPRRRRRRRRRRLHSLSSQVPSYHRTLRYINREREARGESTISIATYRTLRQALLHDRALWMELAGRQPPPEPMGATPEQLLACRDSVISSSEVAAGAECSICLGAYHRDEEVRMLPCNHVYHKACIHHWLEKSTFCPICKFSL